jgi:hypothetical protein
MWFAKLLAASVVVALALAATVAAAPLRLTSATRCTAVGTCPHGHVTRHLWASANGAEKVPVSCETEYGGVWGDEFHGVLITPDTPDLIAIGPDVGPYFAFGSGTGVFTPNGGFEVTCHGVADLTRGPTFVGRGTCFALRGGDEFGHGSRAYAGEGEMVVNPQGKVTITCHGSFTGILA